MRNRTEGSLCRRRRGQYLHFHIMVALCHCRITKSFQTCKVLLQNKISLGTNLCTCLHILRLNVASLLVHLTKQQQQQQGNNCVTKDRREEEKATRVSILCCVNFNVRNSKCAQFQLQQLSSCLKSSPLVHRPMFVHFFSTCSLPKAALMYLRPSCF